jgi:SAM-dependent methyltransferase
LALDSDGVLTDNCAVTLQDRTEMRPKARWNFIRPRLPYNKEFYSYADRAALRSARVLVPFVMSLVNPSSLVDVGCGRGAWLSVFQDYGIEDMLGVDGDWVKSDQLIVRADQFLTHDLATPLSLDRSFDLIVSLEVAEHLPPRAAEEFIESLTRLGDVVLFSAAIPGQGGVHHVNEQWPDYWLDLFQTQGFEGLDCIRSEFWADDRIAPFYLQNAFLAARPAAIDRLPRLKCWAETRANEAGSIARLVHPRLRRDSPAWRAGRAIASLPLVGPLARRVREVLRS